MSTSHIIALPDAACPHCHTPLNQAVVLDGPDDWPRPGDFTLCYDCSTFLQFAENYRLVPPDTRELKALLDTENVPVRRRIRTALKAAVKPGQWQPAVDALVRPAPAPR